MYPLVDKLGIPLLMPPQRSIGPTTTFMSSIPNQQPLDLNYYSAILSASYQLTHHIPTPFPQLLNPLVPLIPYQQAQPTPVLIPTPSAAIPPNPPGQSGLEQRLAAAERALDIEVAARQKLQKQERQFQSKLEEVTRQKRKLSWENEKLKREAKGKFLFYVKTKADLDRYRTNFEGAKTRWEAELNQKDDELHKCSQHLEKAEAENEAVGWKHFTQLGVVNQHKAELDTCRADLLNAQKSIKIIMAERDQLQVQWRVAQDNFAQFQKRCKAEIDGLKRDRGSGIDPMKMDLRAGLTQSCSSDWPKTPEMTPLSDSEEVDIVYCSKETKKRRK
ncbi:hypothetical protein Ddc_15390 [Ditylenchus destructor]|nr:hypothetical protein Ddc_15390 [Ditylenchus destructor]